MKPFNKFVNETVDDIKKQRRNIEYEWDKLMAYIHKKYPEHAPELKKAREKFLKSLGRKSKGMRY